jgi:hypothetical protein
MSGSSTLTEFVLVSVEGGASVWVGGFVFG